MKLEIKAKFVKNKLFDLKKGAITINITDDYLFKIQAHTGVSPIISGHENRDLNRAASNLNSSLFKTSCGSDTTCESTDCIPGGYVRD